MTISKDHIEVLADPACLAARVAAWLFGLACAKEGRFSLCLSGGATPRRLYQCLAQPPYRTQFPWEKIHFFWGDERFVPPDNALSNYAMARQCFLADVAIPPANIHPIPTLGLSPPAAAAEYQRELQGFYGAEQLDPVRPLFDVNLLGLGPDGHTASLFAHSAVLTERERWVAPVPGAASKTRITLTYPPLESSRHAAFLVAGENKADILEGLLAGNPLLPAARLHPVGELWVFSDQAAARR